MSLVYGRDAELGERIEKALADAPLTVTLQKSRRHLLTFRGAVSERHTDWPQRVERASRIRTDAVARAPELLDRFQQQIEQRGGRVIRAERAEDAVRAVLEIARERGVELVAKGKSMITEEIELNAALEAQGVTAVETDLGEWIVQLAGEHPSHLLAPVIHRSRSQIADVLAEERGEAISDDPAAMVAYTRDRLRSAFLEAGIGTTGANFMIAETGTVIVLENEGNGRLVSSIPRCHIVFAGLERVLETTADAAFMVEQLTLAAVGRELPSYVSWISGPAADGDDGPDEVIVIVLDNGRERIRTSDEREILNCIRCGACLTACPVYAKVGGHAYGAVYGGPVGAVLTPLLANMSEDEGRKLPFLSSLCGACTDICPVGIPLHDLLIRGRALANAAGQAGLVERAAWAAWSRAWSNPRLYRASAKAGARSGAFARAFGPGAAWASERDGVPLPARRPFHVRWAELERQG